jgi:hypothetical protein
MPHTISLGTIFSAAGAGGVLLLVLPTMLRRPDGQRDTGIAGIYAFGFATLIALDIFLVWPELRSRLPVNSHLQAHEPPAHRKQRGAA